MIEAGYSFCHHCATVTEDVFYYNSTNAAWIKLYRQRGDVCHIGLCVPAGTTKPEKLKILGSKEGYFDNGHLKHSINVLCEIDGQRETLEFKRGCPFCSKDQFHELLPGIDELPLYVIAVIGDREVGKSCWIVSLSCPENITRVNNKRNNNGEPGYILSTSRLANEEMGKLPSTAVGDLMNTAKTRIMRVVRCGDDTTPRTPVANILLLDFPGEAFIKQETFQKNAAHFFESKENYSGVDAVAFMIDPEEKEKKEIDRNRLTFSDVYNRVNDELQLLEDKPVALIMNKIDKLFGNAPKVPVDIGVGIDLFTEKTFIEQIPNLTDGEMFSNSKMQERVTLSTHLLKNINPGAKYAIQQNSSKCAGFMLKATTPFEEEGKEYLNFGRSINTMDPLIWILNELDIFPIV